MIKVSKIPNYDVLKTSFIDGFSLKRAGSSAHAGELAIEGRKMVADTFSKGMKNPDVCMMAWYDAIAEWVISVAHSNPHLAVVPVIHDALITLSESLSKDKDFASAKEGLMGNLKKLYPKTYKTHLKIFEKNYNTKVNKEVDNIVRNIIKQQEEA